MIVSAYINMYNIKWINALIKGVHYNEPYGDKI